MSIKICLDAGHYDKYNRSPVNSAYWESEMTWKLHLLLKAQLEKYGIEVTTTRPTLERGLTLLERGKTAKGCDLFLSIHSNACTTEKTDHPLACCCVSGAADKLGKQLADTVHEVMGTKEKGKIWKRKGNCGDYYSVLAGAASVGVPGILMEHSYHTNGKATAWLLDDDNLQKLAEAEAEVIAKYYGLEKQDDGITEAETPTEVPPTAPESFLVRVTCAALNVRSGPGLHCPVKQVVRRGEVFTIVETAEVAGATWGKLKSGAGWINITSKYCKRV